MPERLPDHLQSCAICQSAISVSYSDRFPEDMCATGQALVADLLRHIVNAHTLILPRTPFTDHMEKRS